MVIHFITVFQTFHNAYDGLNVDRQLFGIPLVQLSAVLLAAIAFGGMAIQNGAGDMIGDTIRDMIGRLNLSLNYLKL